jgi:hypothetical protein
VSKPCILNRYSEPRKRESLEARGALLEYEGSWVQSPRDKLSTVGLGAMLSSGPRLKILAFRQKISGSYMIWSRIARPSQSFEKHKVAMEIAAEFMSRRPCKSRIVRYRQTNRRADGLHKSVDPSAMSEGIWKSRIHTRCGACMMEQQQARLSISAQHEPSRLSSSGKECGSNSSMYACSKKK